MEKKPEYPVLLTEADWQKDKGLIAKVAGETGVGAGLKRLKAAYDKVDWTIVTQQGFRARVKKGPVTVEVVTKAEAEYKRARPNLQTLLRELDTVETLVERAHGKFKSNKLIPPGSVKHAADVLSKVKSLAAQCDLEDTDRAINMDVAFFIRQVHDVANAKDYIDEIWDSSRALQKLMQAWHKNPDVNEVNADLRHNRRMLEGLMESINLALRHHKDHDFGPYPNFQPLERFIEMKEFPDNTTANDIRSQMQLLNNTYLTKLKAWLKD